MNPSEPLVPSKSEVPAWKVFNPWANPVAYIALPLTVLSAFLLRQPIAAFVGAFILLAALGMFMVAGSFALLAQLRLTESGGTKLKWNTGSLSFFCLLGLFSCVLLAVWPLFAGGEKLSQPLAGGRVAAGFLLSVLCTGGLVACAAKGAELTAERGFLMASYWLCYVPAAVFVALIFMQSGFRGGN
jgi:hypothetical protein